MKAILFDWDGTLVDTLDGFYRANRAVMAAFDLPFDEAIYRRHYTPDWRVMYGRLGIPPDRLHEANELWHRSFDRRSDVVALPGARDALARLRAAGLRTGLVTASPRDLVEPQLARLEMIGLLDAGVFGDDLPVHKPDPAPLRRALTDLGLAEHAAEAVYVGDAPDDMRMAVAAGARAVGVVSILGDADDLRAAGASVVAPSVAAWVDRVLGPAPPPTGT